MMDAEAVPHWKVLVVDDEPSNLSLMRSILKDHVDLCFARSGPALWKRWSATSRT